MSRFELRKSAPAFRQPKKRPVATGVSVAIVNYNGGAMLRRCLRAVSRQSLAPERILVFDNASQDGSCDGMEHRFPAVEVRRLGRNLGFAAAANLAFRESRGCRWVAILNADAVPSRRWLERALAAAETLPDCAAIASQLISATDSRRLDGAGDVYHVCGAAWRAGHGQLRTSHDARLDRQPREVFSACAAAALYRRLAVLRVGGFDEAFFCYFEDVDLGYRLRLAGYRAWYVPRAVVRHVGSASTRPGSDFAVYHGHRNLVWSFVRNTPSRLLWRRLPQHLLWNIVTIAWFALRGRASLILRCKWDALRQLPRVWRSRREDERRRSQEPGARSNGRLAADAFGLSGLMRRGWWRAYWRRD